MRLTQITVALLFTCMLPNILSAQAQDTAAAAVQLDEVVVVNQKSKEATLSYYQTSRQTGIEEIIERMPGLTLIRRGSYAPDIMVRGFRNEQVAITIDGMQIFGACTDRMDPVTSYVETNNLQQINQGACGEASSCNSANIGGGIDLQLKTPGFGGGTHGTLGGGYASNGGGLNTLLSLSTSHKKWSANVNAIYRKQGNYTNGNGEEVNYTQFEKYNVAANIQYRVQQNHLLRLSAIIDDAYNVGYAALPMDVAFAKARIIGLTSTWFTNGAIERINLKAYYNYIGHAMDDSQRPDVPIRMDMPGSSSTVGGFVDAQAFFAKKHELYIKLEGFSNFRHAEMTMYPPNNTEPPMFMLTWPDVRKTTGLSYAQYAYHISKKLHATAKASLQVDYNEVVTESGASYLIPFGYEGPSTYVLPMASLSLDYIPATNQQFNLSASYASRGPSTSEQYAFYLFNAYDGFDYIGNPNIEAEKAFSAEVGYNLKWNAWQLATKAYIYQISDYILGVTDPEMDGMTIGANGVRVYQNINQANTSGIDVALNGKPLHWLEVMAQASYVQGKFNDGTYIPLMPPLQGALGVKFNYQTWQLLVETQVYARQSKVNALYGDMETPGYLLNNIRLLKAFDIGKTILNVEGGVDNVFDVAYRNHLDWGGILRPGRNIYIQLKYSF